jgi:hypothetical protein
MLEKCYECQYYKKGKGSKKCESCPQFKVVLPRQKPCVDYTVIPSQILEELHIPLVVDFYNIVDVEDAILLFQRYHLGLKLREIAERHGISKQAVDRKIKNILAFLSAYVTNKTP